ncbi:MAG: hypothetical protein ACKVI4_16055 [Actinomycetales bacterium]
MSLHAEPSSIAASVAPDRVLPLLEETVCLVDAALHACGHPLAGGTPSVAECAHVPWAAGSVRRLLWLLHFGDALADAHYERTRYNHSMGERVTTLFAHLRARCPLDEHLGIPIEREEDRPSKRQRC